MRLLVTGRERVPRRVRAGRGGPPRAFLCRAGALARRRRGRWPRAAPRRWPAIWTTVPRWPVFSPARAATRWSTWRRSASGTLPASSARRSASGLDRAVFVSTTAVTTTLPARSKTVRLAAEEEIRTSGLSWTILRPTMIYGAAGDRNLSRLLALLARGCRAGPAGAAGGAGARRRPAVAAARPRGGPGRGGADGGGAPGGGARRRYDVAGPEPLTFAELLRASAAAVGCRVRLVPVPLAPVIALTRGYERVSRRPRIRVEQWQRLAEDKAFPIDAAARDLDYAPRPFAEGIRAEAAALGLTPSPPARRPSSRSHPRMFAPRMFAPSTTVLGIAVPLTRPSALDPRPSCGDSCSPHCRLPISAG